jgi:tetratricopeptide (TPR) repeat protein
MRTFLFILLAVVGCVTPKDKGLVENERLAEAASKRGDWAEAAELWHRVYFSEGFEDERACLETARALYELGDPESAEAIVADGIRRFPESSALMEYHGVTLEATGYRRSAEAAYASALELQPDLAVALAGLGRVRLALGLPDSAVHPLKRLVELDPNPEALRVLSQAARATRDFVLAYDTYLHLFDKGEGSVNELVGAATIGLESSLRAERRAAPLVCEAWLKRALEVDPQRTRAHILLGAYRELAGDDEAAVSHLSRACETDPACAEAYLDLAEIHIRMLERETARSFLNNARKLVDTENNRERYELLEAQAEESVPVAD